LEDWRLWSIYRVSRGVREVVGTRVGTSAGEVLSSLQLESLSHFEAEECSDSRLYERAVTYHEVMAARADINPELARDHARRAQGLKQSMRRIKSLAA
jgi:hypothetical protein